MDWSCPGQVGSRVVGDNTARENSSGYFTEDDTQPGGFVERTLIYEALLDRYDREVDDAQVWAGFEK